jgi:IS1 family transposase
VIEVPDTKEGSAIQMMSRRNPVDKKQLWYYDSNCVIRSKLSDMVFGNKASGQTLTMQPWSATNLRGHWKIDGWKVYNEDLDNGKITQVLDIYGGYLEDGTKLITYGIHNPVKDKDNQHFRVEHIPNVA